MVRQIAVNFLYKKSGNSFVPESKDLETAMAFTWAISQESGAKLKKLARVSLPFWIVQVSPDRSVLLGASSSRSYDFSFTHETRLSEVRRLISNEVNEPKDVPDVVVKALSMMDNLETETKSVRNLFEPDAVSEIGQFVSEIEPSYTPNRIEQIFSSQHALAESENFQYIRDDIIARVGRMEELGTLVSDHLRGHLSVLENLVSLERRKWDERISAMKSSTDIATHDLELKKSDELYSLKDDYRKKLRAKTTEFARASADIESYFTYLLEHVQETRVTISQQSDVESAVEEYQKLAKYLTDALPRFEEILEALNEKSGEVLDDAKKFDEVLSARTGETEASVESEIDIQKTRLTKLEKERQEKEVELKDLLDKVKNSIDRIEGRIKKRLLEYQSDVLDLQRMTLENESVRSIAPLTHLDIFFFVGEFSDGRRIILSPAQSLEDRFNLPVSSKPMNVALNSFIQKLISEIPETDSTFSSRLDSAIYEGNLFDNPDTLELVESGLRNLQFNQLLAEGVYESIQRLLKGCMNK